MEEGKKVWLATHVPVFGLEEKSKKAVLPETTAMMLAAWRAASIREKPDIIFAGDRHLLQVVRVENEPLQVIVGSGGVNLDDEPPKVLDGPPKEEKWDFCNDPRFGYLWGKRDGDSYGFAFKPLGRAASVKDENRCQKKDLTASNP